MNQRNVPGIDNAYLAMDTEEGVEVVWNEVMFSERKNFKLQEVGSVSGQFTSSCQEQLCATKTTCILMTAFLPARSEKPGQGFKDCVFCFVI